MRVLFDVVHPAHVHFFRHLRTELLTEGHEALVVAREKDVTVDLLERFGIDHVSTGPAATGRRLPRGIELVRRVMLLRREIRRFGPDILLTRNPSGVQAARLSGVTGVFDTDDGRAAGLLLRAALPFAHVITTPACLRQEFGRRHRRYPGFKALAYLHPNRFEPEPAIRRELDLAPHERLFVVRFSAYTATHDTGAGGLSRPARLALVEHLAAQGRVIVSDERTSDEVLAPYGLSVPPDRLHHVLAAADLCVGDSQTVTAEAAILGTPAIHLSGFSGRLEYLSVLEERYGLVQSFHPSEERTFLRRVAEATSDLDSLGERARTARRRLVSENVDVTSWYRDLVYELAGG